jgi:hypothetical protein
MAAESPADKMGTWIEDVTMLLFGWPWAIQAAFKRTNQK